MTGERRPLAGWRPWLGAAATLAAWVLIAAFAHRLGHQFQPEIVAVLRSPLLQIAAVTVVITGLIWLVALSLPFVPTPGLRASAMVLLWTALIVAGHSLSHMGLDDARNTLLAMHDAVGPLALLSITLVYALALAMPFVPGVELGLLIMLVFGPTGALVAYAATIGGLSLAHALGRLLPERMVVRMLERFGISAGQDGALSQMQRVVGQSRLGRIVPGRLGAWVLEHRYVFLAVSLNFPGNSVVGGGGGLALLCGLTKRFDWRAFLATVAIATSPVPILVLAGWLDLEPLMEHQGFLHDMLTRIERVFVHD